MNNRCRSFSVISVIVLLGTAAATHPATYQIGPERDNTRLHNVTAKLAPGDTVLVDGNATYTGDVKFTTAGTAARKIVVKGIRINGKRPVISGGTNTVHFSSSHHMVFEGFEVSGGSSRGIFHQADTLLLRDIVVRDCPQHGILGADIGSGSLTLEYSEVYNCGDGSSRHQIYMTTDQVNFPGSIFRMQYCYIHDAAGGNNVKSRSERNEIYYNWIEGAYYHELELIGPDPGGVDDGWTIGLKREDSDVVGNVLCKRKTAADNDPDFAVTRLGGDATGWTHGRYRFVNNTVIAGSGAVFRLFDTLESVEMHNNIFYRSNGAVNIYRAAEGEMAWSTGSAVFAGSNNWVVSKSINIPQQWTGTLTGAQPGFVNLSQNDLTLDKSSPCINAGSAECKGPQGFPFTRALSAPQSHPPLAAPLQLDGAQKRQVNGEIDIGAFEYGSSAIAADLFRSIPDRILHFKTVNRAGGTAAVCFTLSSASFVELMVHSLSGRLVKREFSGSLAAGAQTLHCSFFQKNRSSRSGYVIELRVDYQRAGVAYGFCN